MNIKLLKAQSILQEALQEALFDLEDTRLKNIAVTRVECTRGREMAKVFLDENSLGDMATKDALKLLKKASGAIRANLQTQLSWYKTPNLVFEIDDSLGKINRLEEIFKNIHNDSSLRGSNATEAIHESKIDCHDFATQNFAMTSEVDSSLRGARSATKQSINQKIDCFGQSPRNDGIKSHKSESK